MWKVMAGSGGKMPAPRLIQGVERLGATLTEAELFARFMREFVAAWSGVTNYATTREDDYLATKRDKEGWELKHGRWER